MGSSFSSDLCERGSNFPGIQEQLFNRGDYWLFLICKDLSSSPFCKALGPLSLRFEIELQHLTFFVNKYCFAWNPSWGPKMDLEGVRHSICFSGLGWCSAHQPNNHMAGFECQRNWWWWPQGLVVMEHRDVRSIDGIEPEEFIFWINVQAVCWHRKSWFKLLVRYPSITSCSKFGIQICFSTYVECVLQKNLWFLFCHESSTSHLLDTLLTSLPPLQD